MSVIRRAGPAEPPGAEVDTPYSNADLPLTVVSAEVSVVRRLADIWEYRELVLGMIRKELRVQYKDSRLGFVWSLLNPTVTLGVYFVVFQIILKNNIPRFALYLMAGNLVWNFFASAVPSACGSVVYNANLIKKVAFPREIPALAVVGSNLVQMGYQSLIMVLFLVIYRRGPAVEYLPLLIPALVAVILLACAFGILFAAVNVRMRDMQHLLTIAIQVWFWATPIVYPYRLIRDRIVHFTSVHGHVVAVASGLYPLLILYRLNPITPIVLTFQRALYASTSPGRNVHVLPDHAGPWWYLWQLGLVTAFALLLLALAIRVFGRLEANFAEEL